MPFKVTVDEDKCIGCGACANVCDNFRMEGGVAVVMDEDVEERGCNEDARHGCPVQAIEIVES